MQTTRNIDFRCPSCGYTGTSSVTAIVDPSENPQAKDLLLTGRLNVIQCPNCNTPSTASTPLVYHDASKEMLLTFVPMQLEMNEQEADKFIGQLIREITDNMDSKMVKGYVLQPTRALTMQGLIEQVLESEGVSKEMMEDQKNRSRLVQTFLQTDPSKYEELVAEHDDRMDMQFFQTMSIIAQRYMQEGRQELAQQVLQVQEQIAQLSTVGKELIQQSEQQEVLVREVAEELQGLTERPTPPKMLEIVRPHAGDHDRLQAYVGLARGLFDDQFFAALDAAIEDADGDEQAELQQLHETLVDLTDAVDQQSQAQMQQAANVLRQILNADGTEAAIRANIAHIDETFMAVLELNINEAQKHNDLDASAKMKGLRDQIMRIVQENMTPEVRFINNLLTTPDEASAQQMIDEKANEFGPELLEVFDALEEVIASQGQQDVLERLKHLRSLTEATLS